MPRGRYIIDDVEPPRPRGRLLRRSWRQRVLIALGILLAVTFGAAAAVVAYAWNLLGDIGRIDDLSVDSAPAGEPENYLIVGSDSRANGNGEFGDLEGQRSDTIMVARIDPQDERATVVSFPRDLWVPIAGTGESNLINSAYDQPDGRQVLIDTLRQNFGIEIHHYVEIDFEGFERLVDAVGGVELWFESAVRDTESGLFVQDLGCVNLGGEMALNFARARHLEYMTQDGWRNELVSDLGRITRQQIFMRQALRKAKDEATSNPLRLRELVDIGVDTIDVDERLSTSDILDLVDRFKDFDPDELETYGLPVVEMPDDPNRVLVDRRRAEPVLNIFRGLPAGEVSPGLVSLTVLNGSGKDGQANNASAAFQAVGFDVGEPETTDPHPRTTVYHRPGDEAYGLLVARHITGGADLAVRDDLGSGEVVVVTGADFTTIHEQPTPIDEMPLRPGGPTTTSAGASAPPAESDDPNTPSAPPTPPATIYEGAYATGEPPPGETCG